VFGASAAPMFMNCLGSLIPNLLAEDESSYEAAEGTVAHHVAETWLKEQKQPLGLIGETILVPRRNGEPHAVEVTEEMLSYVEEYVAWVSTTPGEHYVELKVDYSSLTPIPDQGGTADHVFAEWQRLTVTDLKYGKGIKVFAEKNEQALAYAAGVFLRLDWLYDFQTIVIRICQPRLEHFDEWICTREELLEFMERFRTQAAAAWVPGAPRTPGPKQCQWCKIRTECPAKFAITMEAAQGAFADDDDEPASYPAPALAAAMAEAEMISTISPVDIPSLSVEALERISLLRSTIERWLREIDEHLQYLAECGVELKHHDIKRGRAGHRAWINKKAAARYLLQQGIERFDLFSETMASPSQAETLLKIATGAKGKGLKALLEPYVIQPPGRLTLAPKADKRLTVEPAASAFDDD
jgi:hypothetical protein